MAGTNSAPMPSTAIASPAIRPRAPKKPRQLPRGFRFDNYGQPGIIPQFPGRGKILGRVQPEHKDGVPPEGKCADHAAALGRFYLRFTVEDHPGVLARIAGVLGRHDISIASVIQREIENRPDASDDVSLVIMTHTANEGKAAAAVAEIDGLPSIRAGSVRMRVLEE